MTDNWELLRRADQTATDGKTSSKAPLRQVTSITSWAQCFMANAAILLSKFPHKVVEVMAYGKMIIREAGRHGGEGWKVYDTLFRQMVAADKTTPRSKLNSTLYATTFLSMCDPHGQGAQCLIYMESDHREVDCALTSDHMKGSSGSYQGNSTTPRQLFPAKHTCSRTTQFCRAFNFASCSGPQECIYWHTCLCCRKGSHRVSECPEPPPQGDDDNPSVPKSARTSKPPVAGLQ